MSNSDHDFDLIIRGNRVIDASLSLDGPCVIGIRGKQFAAIGESIDCTAKRELDFPNAIILPGLIDLHAHPDVTGSVFGVDPDEHCLKRGTTTVMSQGDSGADNCAQYVAQTIHGSKTRVRLAISISRIGETTPGGSCADLMNVDIEACVAAINKYSDYIWGIAVNVSRHTCESTDPKAVLDRGIAAAEAINRPILYGMRPPHEWSFEEQMQMLRPGDVVTYTFRREPHCIIENGGAHPAIKAARERGVLFDVCYGTGSFDFTVAEAAIADGFLPDTISTDLYAPHVGQEPIHDLPITMSKLIAAGMAEADVLAAVAATPAQILGLSHEIGSLSVGKSADVTILESSTETQALDDVNGNVRHAYSWQPHMTIRAGEVIE